MSFKKEAEMKAVKFAGLILLVAGSVAAAGPMGTVTWNIAPTAAVTPIPAGTSKTITWVASVVAAGANQGLASFSYDMAVWAPGQIPFEAGQFPVAFQPAASTWATCYGVQSPVDGTRLGTKKRVIDSAAAAGGPGMYAGAGLTTTGNITPGYYYIAAAGTGYSLAWASSGDGPLRAVDSGEVDENGDPIMVVAGAVTAGIGRVDQASRLLSNGSSFAITYGSIPVTNAASGVWAPGVYTVTLRPNDTFVLNAGIDLNTFQDGTIVTQLAAADVNGGGYASFTFTILPEPTTLLLLAGAGLLYRRRHA